MVLIEFKNLLLSLAKKRKRKKLTNATKSNGISITMPFWDERFERIKKISQILKQINFI